MIVGGKVVAINGDFVAVGLDDDGDRKVATRKDSSISFILLILPFVMDIAVAGDVV